MMRKKGRRLRMDGGARRVAGFASVPVRPFCLSSVPFFIDVDVGVDFDRIGILLPYLACFVKRNETKRNERVGDPFVPSVANRTIGLVHSHAGVLRRAENAISTRAEMVLDGDAAFVRSARETKSGCRRRRRRRRRWFNHVVVAEREARRRGRSRASREWKGKTVERSVAA